MVFLDLGVGDGWDHRSQQVAGCSPRRLYRPCRARPADRSLAAEDRSAGGVRDRAGPEPAGTRWVHAEPAGRGVQRARAVTSGGEEPQVKPPAQPRPATPSGGGPEFETPHPVAASPPGSCPRGGGSPRTGLTLQASWSRHRQDEHRCSCPAVPPACHKQRSPAVSSGQPRSLREDRCAAHRPLTCGGKAARHCMACKCSPPASLCRARPARSCSWSRMTERRRRAASTVGAG
jgi:hypothetical protein